MKKQIWISVLVVFLIAVIVGIVLLQRPKENQTDDMVQQQKQTQAATDAEQETTQEPEETTKPSTVSHVVVLDPGHQAGGNSEKEPIGPGASEQKAKVSTGTQGRYTGLAEYELNLQIATQLSAELEKRGYTVFMTRKDNDTDISNVERAQYASQVGGEILVRIHANGSDNTATSGAMTICQTPDNPYQSLYTQSRLLSDCILQTYCAATGFASQNVWQTDTMTGINWCQIPSTIVEMGYMTNESDDTSMADQAVQAKMVQGIADGIDLYFEKQSQSQS